MLLTANAWINELQTHKGLTSKPLLTIIHSNKTIA